LQLQRLVTELQAQTMSLTAAVELDGVGDELARKSWRRLSRLEDQALEIELRQKKAQ